MCGIVSMNMYPIFLTYPVGLFRTPDRNRLMIDQLFRSKIINLTTVICDAIAPRLVQL